MLDLDKHLPHDPHAASALLKELDVTAGKLVAEAKEQLKSFHKSSKDASDVERLVDHLTTAWTAHTAATAGHTHFYENRKLDTDPYVIVSVSCSTYVKGANLTLGWRRHRRLASHLRSA